MLGEQKGFIVFQSEISFKTLPQMETIKCVWQNIGSCKIKVTVPQEFIILFSPLLYIKLLW